MVYVAIDKAVDYHSRFLLRVCSCDVQSLHACTTESITPSLLRSVVLQLLNFPPHSDRGGVCRGNGPAQLHF